MNIEDTIAAICTGHGGAISIIRIAGPTALETGRAAWQGHQKLHRNNARKMLFGKIVRNNGQSGDSALAVYMPAPNSYTGDDVVELHCHGGAAAAREALESTLINGARQAEPGEFTFRAFINGKMDLTQVEAVCDLITAHSDMALHLAERQIDGVLGRQVATLRQTLTDILAECESRLDFPEEELDWTSRDKTILLLNDIADKVTTLIQTGRDGAVLRSGIRVVLAGRPNSGKSSLLNLLLGFDRAIVTSLPGTTRDTIEENANIRGIPVTLIDTAGIREASNMIEGMGIDRSRQSIRQAKIVIWLLDAASAELSAELAEMQTHAAQKSNLIAVWNKIDLALADVSLPATTSCPSVCISVTENIGIEQLLDTFERVVWEFPHTEEPEVAINQRHAKLLEETLNVTPEAIAAIGDSDWELAAVPLRQAMNTLGQILGEQADPDILDNIFSRFCIGK